ncbi:mpv17-like protein 2 [Anopheles nili]|uniref:mpv17-like protein 2 n=1 Tax=Anopheles nili TaxID=185578 RepID=UPI00237AAADB|nr:mpv17-like protein 2 [Anopheles nili]
MVYCGLFSIVQVYGSRTVAKCVRLCFVRNIGNNTSSRNPKKTAGRRQIWNLLFGRYLLVTNTVSSGVLMMAGDIAAQEVERRRDQTSIASLGYDWWRVANMTLVGISQGPLHHYLYKWMDVILPGASFATVFKKIAIDQFVISPIFIVTYLYSAGLLEGASVVDCSHELREKYWIIYTADWLVWPPTQFINFYLVSPKYRVLYINAITMLYNVFLCYIKHNNDLTFLPLKTAAQEPELKSSVTQSDIRN